MPESGWCIAVVAFTATPRSRAARVRATARLTAGCSITPSTTGNSWRADLPLAELARRIDAPARRVAADRRSPRPWTTLWTSSDRHDGNDRAICGCQAVARFDQTLLGVRRPVMAVVGPSVLTEENAPWFRRLRIAECGGADPISVPRAGSWRGSPFRQQAASAVIKGRCVCSTAPAFHRSCRRRSGPARPPLR